MAEITDTAIVPGASIVGATAERGRSDAASSFNASIVALDALDITQWRSLSERAIEPNGYYLADWMLAVNATAPGRTGASALAVRDTSRRQLAGLMPVISLWRAFKIPLPALVSAHPYGTLCTPTIDRERAESAVAGLLQAARDAGAHALILRETSLEGEAMRMLTEMALRSGLPPRVLQSHRRALLDATRDADLLLREALGGKKLKELRRQRHRLEEHGPVSFTTARTPQEVASAIEVFLKLEASGWKGRRGTALIQTVGDAAFIRRATVVLAKQAQCEIVILRVGETPVAAGRPAPARARLLLQARGRREFRKILTGRAADAGTHAPSLRRSRDCKRRFHRRPRSPHDQPDLARPPRHRRRADPAAAERSGGRGNSCSAARAAIAAEPGASGHASLAQTEIDTPLIDGTPMVGTTPCDPRFRVPAKARCGMTLYRVIPPLAHSPLPTPAGSHARALPGPVRRIRHISARTHKSARPECPCWRRPAPMRR